MRKFRSFPLTYRSCYPAIDIEPNYQLGAYRDRWPKTHEYNYAYAKPNSYAQSGAVPAD